MALPASGQISFTDIQTEFGGSNPISLTEYYGYAPGIPTSGQVSTSDFYNTAKPALSGAAIEFSNSNSVGATAGLVVKSTGETFERTGDTGSTSDSQINASTDWVIPNGLADAQYEVSATVDSGDAVTNADGSWLALGSDVVFSFDTGATGPGQIKTKSASMTVSIRFNGSVVLATNTYTLFAECDRSE